MKDGAADAQSQMVKDVDTCIPTELKGELLRARTQLFAASILIALMMHNVQTGHHSLFQFLGKNMQLSLFASSIRTSYTMISSNGLLLY